MKVNICSPGRAWMLDIARELAKCGWDVKFYSYVPTHRTVKFGLPKHCNKSLFGILFPFFILLRLFPKANRRIRILLMIVQDYITALYMRKCDVFIALSSNYDYALQKAKKQGAIVLIECGTKHILEKKRILESISALKTKKTIPDIYEKIELASYKLANYVMIPSEHVKESFKLHNYPAEKLFVNPYCASLSHFYPTDNPANSSYDVIMVGQWCYRKGCDLLTKACLNILGVKLLHVGSVVDCPLPNHPLFTHIEPVDESQLINYYAQAKIFALPSLEEGLALVQPQALVCGLPIVCSKDTGGRDLQNFLDDKKWIIEMPETNVECLAECIKKALLLADTQSKGKRNYAGKAIDQLTWDAYGKRYSEFLKQITTS